MPAFLLPLYTAAGYNCMVEISVYMRMVGNKNTIFYTLKGFLFVPGSMWR